MNLFDVYPINDITITRAKGSYVWDETGQQYLDMYGGHAVISIGHTHPHYVERITGQLQQVGFYSNSVKNSSCHSPSILSTLFPGLMVFDDNPNDFYGYRMNFLFEKSSKEEIT